MDGARRLQGERRGGGEADPKLVHKVSEPVAQQVALLRQRRGGEGEGGEVGEHGRMDSYSGTTVVPGPEGYLVPGVTSE